MCPIHVLYPPSVSSLLYLLATADCCDTYLGKVGTESMQEYERNDGHSQSSYLPIDREILDPLCDTANI